MRGWPERIGSMDEVLVSVIVPVYKAKEFLAPCMESIFAQDYEPMEIILVDDGSPDECPALCDAYAGKNEGVRVIHQENRGLGMARNAGLVAARGKYVCFVDSDDELDGPTCIRCMVARAEKKHADITQGSFRRIGAAGSRSDAGVSGGKRLRPNDARGGVNRHHLRGGSYTDTADFRFKGFYYYGHLAYNWGKLYRRQFLLEHRLFCRAYPFSQDKAHNAACLSYHPVYAFVDESVYCYRVNESSVSFRYKENLIPVWVAIAKDYLRFCKKRGVQAYEDLMAFHIFFGSFFVVKQELLAKNGIGAARRALKRYGAQPLAAHYMRALSRGAYIGQVRGGVWNVVIPVAAWLFGMHAYGLYALGIACLEFLQIDRRITESRHEGRG